MTFAQERNRLTMHFLERIPVVKWRMSVFTWWLRRSRKVPLSIVHTVSLSQSIVNAVCLWQPLRDIPWCHGRPSPARLNARNRPCVHATHSVHCIACFCRIRDILQITYTLILSCLQLYLYLISWYVIKHKNVTFQNSNMLPSCSEMCGWMSWV